jgi:hypothetical protein
LTEPKASKTVIEENKSGKKIAKKSTPTHKSAQGSGEKYYQNFDFYFKRTSFRTMTLYFKTQYKPFYESWKAQKKSTSVIPSLAEFVNHEFKGLLT